VDRIELQVVSTQFVFEEVKKNTKQRYGVFSFLQLHNRNANLRTVLMESRQKLK
jgi:hypothetical protein